MKLTRNVRCGSEVEFGLVMSLADLAAINAGLSLAATFLHDDATKSLQAELQAEIDRVLPACRTIRAAANQAKQFIPGELLEGPDLPDAQPLPPVLTGPGGDFVEPWPRNSRPYTRELTGRSVAQIRQEAQPHQA
jgi:hypothetical protein